MVTGAGESGCIAYSGALCGPEHSSGEHSTAFESGEEQTLVGLGHQQHIYKKIAYC